MSEEIPRPPALTYPIPLRRRTQREAQAWREGYLYGLKIAAIRVGSDVRVMGLTLEEVAHAIAVHDAAHPHA